MSQEPFISGHLSGEQLQCPRCHASLPAQAQFCSSCGLAFRVKPHRAEIDTLDSIETPDLESRTIRVPREKLWYWKAAQQNGQELLPLPDRITQQVSSAIKPSTINEQGHYPDMSGRGSALSSLPTTPLPETLMPVHSTTTRPIATGASSYNTSRFWPTIIIASALATALVTFVVPGIFVRPFIVFWFISVCPGMTLVPYFHVREKATIWTLALALSFTIDALVAAAQLYAKVWSPSVTLAILLLFCFGGSIIQPDQVKQWRLVLAKQLHRKSTASHKRW
jgi:ribosomal protein L40E